MTEKYELREVGPCHLRFRHGEEHVVDGNSYPNSCELQFWLELDDLKREYATLGRKHDRLLYRINLAAFDIGVAISNAFKTIKEED